MKKTNRPPYDVLYTKDLEPINVISVTPFMWEMIEKEGMVRVVPFMPLSVTVPNKEMPGFEPLRYVTIEPFPIRNEFGAVIKTMLVTSDEIDALAVKPDWLPGQRGEVNRLSEQAHQALFMMMRPMG